MPIEFEKLIEVPESAFKDESVARLHGYLTEGGKMEEPQAKALVEALLSEGAMAVGDAYLEHMGSYVRQLEGFRNELRARTTELLTALRKGTPREKLPARLSVQGFRQIFRSLEITLEKLKAPEEVPIGDPAAPGPDRLFTPAEIDQWLGALGDEPPPGTEVPRVKGGKIDPQTSPDWEGEPNRPVRVPRKKGQATKFDIIQIVRLAGEKLIDAVARVRQVIGKRIDNGPLEESPLKGAWDRAVEHVLEGRTVESLGKDGALEAYEKCRARFWLEVGHDTAAREFLEGAGFDVKRDGGAPTLKVTDPNVPVEQIRISLDHVLEKGTGDNWKLALDGDNLRFEFHAPNSFRDSLQRRLGIGTYWNPAP